MVHVTLSREGVRVFHNGEEIAHITWEERRRMYELIREYSRNTEEAKELCDSLDMVDADDLK